jgi:mRNA-degrading endonuclease RelE of RelBE toxin-antitoxin system
VSSTYQLTLSRDAIKFVAKQERVIQERIRKALTGLAVRPPVGDIKPLKGRGKLMRLRAGTYRVIFEVDQMEQMVYILTIGETPY